MQGLLNKNAFGRWEIVDNDDNRVELSSGDVIEIYVYRRQRWVATRIESRGGAYYAVEKIPLYSGQPARTTDTPRFRP